MKKVKIKECLREERIYGYWSILPLPQIHEIFGDAGMKFAIIDFEHGSQSFQHAIESIIAIERQEMYPLIRPSSHDGKEILRCLETGAQGLCIPHIRNVKEARDVVNASFYPPFGNRGASGFTRATRYGQTEFNEHKSRANKELFICIMIESIEGLNNLEEICEIEEVNCIYFGTFDIACDAGIDDQNSDEVRKLISVAIDKVSRKREDMIFGQVAVNKDQLQKMDRRITFVPYGVDCGVIQRGVDLILGETRPVK